MDIESASGSVLLFGASGSVDVEAVSGNVGIRLR
jgi:hypothetical protein